MALSDDTQMKQMQRDKPSMTQKGPAARDVCDPMEHKAKPLSDDAQFAQMKRK